MNFPRPFLPNSNPFRPAIEILSDRFSAARQTASKASRAYLDDEAFADMSFSNLDTPKSSTGRSIHSRTSSAEVDSTTGVPLIDFSRTPSPTPYRATSATQSEDEDDNIFSSSLRPLVADSAGGPSLWKVRWRDGGLGAFLFGSWAGWQVYVGIITAVNVTFSILLVFLNRVILLYGVYKFPYPLTATWIQLLFCHVFLLIWAAMSRWFAGPLRKIGLTALIAPSHPQNSQSGGARVLGFSSLNPLRLISAISKGNGGIAGGGLLEFHLSTAKTVLPLSVIFIGKILLSNISFAYSALPLYTLCRIGIIPLTLILTSTFGRTTHSVATLSSCLTAWLNLLIASIRTRSIATWEAIVAGVFSILFVSLYPILLERTHKLLIASQVRAGDVLTSFSPTTPYHDDSRGRIESGSKQSTRAYYQLLHYNSILSLIILSPMVLISGELPRIFRNCYFLDVFWFWFICACGGFCAFVVYSSSLAMVRATSPLTSCFVGVPRAAVQIVIFNNFRLPVHSWVGVALCWAGSGWYALVRREEGRLVEKKRLEGR
ncbi:hypothetical protein BT63DRAFT_372583 [Microthyrium microscopicum]|uniref:GDP-mannose transporter n=1 Tax=Microthyrium microscopicum TaxID=703497 RepID=A0A6A6UDR8_9PEZI|nr:hypothetical protein BT63DRAFT_372583 [Microthyrium microscopicum]